MLPSKPWANSLGSGRCDARYNCRLGNCDQLQHPLGIYITHGTMHMITMNLLVGILWFYEDGFVEGTRIIGDEHGFRLKHQELKYR